MFNESYLKKDIFTSHKEEYWWFLVREHTEEERKAADAAYHSIPRLLIDC